MPRVEQAITISTQQLAPQQMLLPASVLGAYRFLHGIHRYWHFFRQGQIYSNPNNFLALTSGHALDFAVGGNRYVRLAAQALWISQCVIECVESFKTLNTAYVKWRDAVRCRYPVVVIHPWRTKLKSTWISPSTMQNFYVTAYTFEYHFRDIAGRTWKLFVSIIYLSDATITATDAFYIDSTSKSKAVKHSILNGMKCMDTLSENRAELVQKLKQNKAVINVILANIPSPCRADQFISYVDKAAGQAQGVNGVISKVNKSVGGKVSNTLKFIFFGAMSAVGLGQFVPIKLVPRRGRIDDNSDTKVYGRYTMVTKPMEIKEDGPLFDFERQYIYHKPVLQPPVPNLFHLLKPKTQAPRTPPRVLTTGEIIRLSPIRYS